MPLLANRKHAGRAMSEWPEQVTNSWSDFMLSITTMRCRLSDKLVIQPIMPTTSSVKSNPTITTVQTHRMAAEFWLRV
jgi:hypothetical protein